jgi:hypothetical protein
MIPVTDALGVQSEANSNRVQRDPFLEEKQSSPGRKPALIKVSPVLPYGGAICSQWCKVFCESHGSSQSHLPRMSTGAPLSTR